MTENVQDHSSVEDDLLEETPSSSEEVVYSGPYSADNAGDKDVRVELYDANEGKSPRTGGPYLDQVEREEAEKRRAKVEGREPDLDNPPAVAATVLVPKHHLVERDTDKSHYSDAVEVTTEPVGSYVVPAEKTEPDPTQPDWDNDMSKVAALEAGLKMDELKAKAESSKTDDNA